MLIKMVQQVLHGARVMSAEETVEVPEETGKHLIRRGVARLASDSSPADDESASEPEIREATAAQDQVQTATRRNRRS